jgi:opacity protein-like surface antigen
MAWVKFAGSGRAGGAGICRTGSVSLKRTFEEMKKIILLSLLLVPMAGFAQESRQDVSISAVNFSMPQTNGNGVQQTATISLGGLVGYRYMLTPHSALEGNYSYTQDSMKFYTSTLTNGRVLTRVQEMSAAYVYSLNFKRFNPYGEAGIGVLMFTPLTQAGTNQLDARQSTEIAALLGLGVAYELSPSWDIRLGYHEYMAKAPNFNVGGVGNTFKTNAYTLFNYPSIGVAYHF